MSTLSSPNPLLSQEVPKCDPEDRTHIDHDVEEKIRTFWLSNRQSLPEQLRPEEEIIEVIVSNQLIAHVEL